MVKQIRAGIKLGSEMTSVSDLVTPNIRHAAAFLTALDEDSESWTFQTFDDRKPSRKHLIRQFYGPLEEHQDALADLNAEGAGVFVAINQTDGKGRRKENITRVRALFVDLDGAPLEPVLADENPPHVVVETSPGRWHAYWRVADCGLNQCEPALKSLIGKFGADPACSDRSRVMRLPGFVHQKAEPRLVRILESTPGDYILADLLQGTQQKRQKEQKNQQSSSVSSVSSVRGVIRRHLPTTAGQRNRCLFNLARHLQGVAPGLSRDDLRNVVMEWHQAALPVIGTPEFAESWGDFYRSWVGVRVPYGSVLSKVLAGLDRESPIPGPLATLGYQERGWLLVQVCRALQNAAGNAPFFLSSRQAGELIDLNHVDASRHLSALVADGILELVSRGSGLKASRYRFVWNDREVTL